MKASLEKFDLQLALKGNRKVVTRGGKEVINIKFKEENVYPVKGVVVGDEDSEGQVLSFDKNGCYTSGPNPNKYDLFLMPEVNTKNAIKEKLKTKDFELVHLTSRLHDKFVTRAGNEVSNLQYNPKFDNNFPVIGNVDGLEITWTENGKYALGGGPDERDLMTVVEDSLKDPFTLPGFTEDLRLFLGVADICDYKDLITKCYNENYTVEEIAKNVRALKDTPIGNYVEAIKEAVGDQPQGIKAYIETGRIKCAEGPHESMPPQSVVDSIKYVAQSINNDPVNKPSHYTDGKIEVIDFIDDKGFDYCIGNAIKYLSRAGKKQNEIEDLEKAVWYINHKIQKLKNGDAIN